MLRVPPPHATRCLRCYLDVKRRTRATRFCRQSRVFFDFLGHERMGILPGESEADYLATAPGSNRTIF